MMPPGERQKTRYTLFSHRKTQFCWEGHSPLPDATLLGKGNRPLPRPSTLYGARVPRFRHSLDAFGISAPQCPLLLPAKNSAGAHAYTGMLQLQEI